MKISINDLKCLCEKILTRAEQSGLRDIEVNVDYYRILDNLYDLNVEKTELIIGSFIDDWDSLQKVLSNKNPPTTLDLERLGNVIKIVSDSIRKSRNIII